MATEPPAAREHPCPKGDDCALNRGAVHCLACRRNWPRDETWDVPFEQRPVRERDAASAYYSDDFVTIYHGDCREIAPQLGLDFAVVTDPPYGMAWNTDSTRFTGDKRGMGRDDWGNVQGDSELFDPSTWLEYPAVVLWGSNHYAAKLPKGTTLVWLKRADHLFGSFLSDAEIAWRKGGHGVYVFRKQFPPPSRMVEAFGEVAHPTQKPLSLMSWCIQRCGDDSLPILDPYAGSGTTLRAAKDLGRRVVGIEIEERYCDLAARRCAQEVLAA